MIQEVHREQKAIYSYTVFSVLSEVLKELNPDKYKMLYQQTLPSICLKGVANSYDPLESVTLKQRYYDFCMKFVSKLYDIPQKKLNAKQVRFVKDSDLKLGGKKKKVKVDYKIYDILG
ncbi:MAG: hypothetical protein K2O03_13675, partial [Lachnospiraceae bacterium]|nr:hypothetical protein [Lachnospiraceae bacterium]